MSVDVAQLSCQELVELVTDYLEGALAPEEAARFEAHIGRCTGCAAYLEQFRQTIVLAGRLTRGVAAARGRERAARRLPRLALALTPPARVRASGTTKISLRLKP